MTCMLPCVTCRASLPHLPSSSSMSVCPSATVKSATFKFWESSPSNASFETTNVKQIYFSVADPSMVGPATEQIRRVIQARHRAESVYNVTNLTQLVAVAEKTANALTIVLLLVAAVVLLVSGIGIMNIMLATVSARIREIGIRKALGATKREIQFQFLAEAILISLIGGLLGVIMG